MPAELTLCFIDDSLFERELFLDIFPPAAPDWDLLAVESFAQAREVLSSPKRQGRPILFLLDLWGNDPAPKKPSAPASSPALKWKPRRGRPPVLRRSTPV